MFSSGSFRLCSPFCGLGVGHERPVLSALFRVIPGCGDQQQTIEEDDSLDISGAAFFLQHKDGTIIYLNDIIDFDSVAKVSGENRKIVKTFTVTPSEEPEGEDTVTPTGETASYSESLKFAGAMTLNLDDTYSMNGVMTTSQKLGFTKAPNKLPVILSGAAKISSLSGQISPTLILEGSAAFSAGVAADVTPYLNAMVEEGPES